MLKKSEMQKMNQIFVKGNSCESGILRNIVNESFATPRLEEIEIDGKKLKTKSSNMSDSVRFVIHEPESENSLAGKKRRRSVYGKNNLHPRTKIAKNLEIDFEDADVVEDLKKRDTKIPAPVATIPAGMHNLTSSFCG